VIPTIRNVLFCIVATLTSACALKDKHPVQSGYWPSKARWAEASRTALKSPGTWVPAAGAVIFQIDDLDEQLSDWAIRHQPIFGSTDNALEASDNLLSGPRLTMFGTAIAVPRGEGPWESKFGRILLEQLIVTTTNKTTVGLKELTGRLRPDGSDNMSMPSGHSSNSVAYATLAARNLKQLQLTPLQQRTFEIGVYSLAAGTAWARVEAGEHYPSDVLAGSALGHFLASLLHDAFIDQEYVQQVTLNLHDEGASFQLVFRY
jgi:hypothetical protein